MATARSDISGFELPRSAIPNADTANPPITVNRQPEIEPPSWAKEYLIAYSIVAAPLATSQLFVLTGTVVTAGAALQLPENQKARIDGVLIEGDTGPTPGTPLLQFSLRTTPDGQQRLSGWETVNLPTRGGIVNLAIEPFTIISAGYFLGAFVQNFDVSSHYAAIMIRGWIW